jgi:hypothetical protein
MHFEVANTAITKDLGIAFESDFFETLDKTIEDYLEYFKHVV